MVTYSGAGHPLSLLFRKSRGQLVELAENGRERLIQFLLTMEHLDPSDLISGLFSRIASEAPQDDLTVVLAQGAVK